MKHARKQRSPNSDEPNESEDTIDSIQQIGQKDLIQTLVKLNILPRIRYLLEHHDGLPHMMVVQLLEIVSLLAQHSKEIATAMIETPRLLSVINDRFIKLPFNFVSLTTEAKKIRMDLQVCLHCFPFGT